MTARPSSPRCQGFLHVVKYRIHCTVSQLLFREKKSSNSGLKLRLVAQVSLKRSHTLQTVVFHRCHDVDSEERRRDKKEEKCPFLENSGSEEDVLQILQYMATILSK